MRYKTGGDHPRDVYLRHFTYALGERAGYIRALQWALCVPVFSNLALGQMNVFLVICLGEFVLASPIGRHSLGGFWLGGMLMKPHTLILLLPGLIIRKNWQALLGFIGSALAILLVSTLLAGWYGVWIGQAGNPVFWPTDPNWSDDDEY